jgi:hypothetical protein
LTSTSLLINDRLNILCIEHTFILEANLGIGLRPSEGSLNFNCFVVFLGSVKNIKESAFHIVPETVPTIRKILRLYDNGVMLVKEKII